MTPEEKEYDYTKCPTCQANEAAEDHPCPFLQDVENDEETMCNCCSECEQRCADDI